MTETINSEVIEIDENNPSAAEIEYAIAQLTHVCNTIQNMNDNAGEGYKAVRKMAGKSFINMREQDLGFMRGYWLGLNAALHQIDMLLDDQKDLRSELIEQKQEGENAGA